ncbi:dicarboxylic amino acid permease [Phlyctema vagabunda]|uniref:Dicarboxylic amino acid permease n=1 Tax=Phlyctema vagabunda TaxID=108571 RepID=A0ABR4P5R6_9HELO
MGTIHEYNDIELNAYHGMEVNQYTEDLGDGGSGEKVPFHPNYSVYDEDPRSRLHRDLKTRQLAMIALGGALGTGLLINTGTVLAQSGPGSTLIGYALVGILCYAVMAAMGEMAAWLPMPSGFTGFAHRFVDPALGFALGWNYWFKYIITTPNNLVASALVVQYWYDKRDYTGPGANPGIYVAIFLVVIITVNYFGVGFFGEFEFWLSSVKVLIIIGLIIFSVVIAAGGGPDHDPKGFRYWKDPDGAGGRFLAFWSVLTNAVFSFLGAELVGVTVGEASNPRKAIPRAVQLTFFRIVIFYLVLILLLGMNVPYDDDKLQAASDDSKGTTSAKASPFVVASSNAGIEALPSLINACILVFTFSAANSDLYIASRTLYGLSLEGSAPRIFSRTDHRGVPIYALGLSSAFCLIAFVSVNAGAFQTFQYFISLVTIFGLLTWISILVSHIYFLRARTAQNIPDSALAYVSPFGLYGSAIALAFACLIGIFNGWADFVGTFSWKDFIVDYIGFPIYLAMIFGYKLVMKTQGIKPEDADLFSGKAKIDEDEAEFVANEMRRKGGVTETKYERLYRYTLGNLF